MWLFALLVPLCHSASVRREPLAIKKSTIQMIGYSPTKNDDYVAVSMVAPTGYIVAFNPVASADRVHHMLLYGCSVPAEESTFWKGERTCGQGPTHILYAWARNAPPLQLPKGVGFALGEASETIKYLVLQVHYAQPFAGNVLDYSGVTLHVSGEKPANLAAVLLLVTGEPIPPHMKQFQDNISCHYQSPTVLHPFAFRTHTHGMGRLVSAYYKRNNLWTKIGARNPQWPQLFEEITHPLEIHQGDILAGSCRFDSSNQNVSIPMGSMGSNEMCNFYMMYFYKAEDENPFPYGGFCGGRERMDDMDGYPKEGTELLPPRPELEHHAHQSAVPFGVVEKNRTDTVGDVKLGQISGLAFDRNGDLVIFHRGSAVWNAQTFDMNNRLTNPKLLKDPVVLVQSKSGLKKMGSGLFYMPHGVFVDGEGAFYMTDVGSHTVSKYVVEGGELKQLWVAGTPLEPGNGPKHFCKPTAVTRIGDSIFVSDGYCNARIVELTMDGQFKGEFGGQGNAPGQFVLPHDIVATEKNTIMVADRENGRVQEVRSDGSVVDVFASSLFNNIYSVDVDGDYVLMIPGELRQTSFGGSELPISVFVGRHGTGLIEYSFSPSRPFVRPHVIRVSPNKEDIYVADIGDMNSKGNVLVHFKIQLEHTGMGSMSSLSGLPSLSIQAPSSSLFFFLVIIIIAVFAFFLKRRYDAGRKHGEFFDRKGFKVLRQDDKLTFSSDSDSD